MTQPDRSATLSPTPLLAFLLLEGRPRLCCIGCSTFLERLGLLRVIAERPLPVMNAAHGAFISVVYEIVAPYTLANCRSLIASRHVGAAWGE